MKTVLAELHELINDLEDQGLTAEASTLQEVFVRVAEEADMDAMEEPADEGDDLANDVAGLLKSHSASEVLAEIAKQMGGEAEPAEESDETSSFAFGDEPDAGADPEKQAIVSKYSNMYITQKMSDDDALAAAQAEWSKQNTDPIILREITSGQAKAPGYDYAAAMAKSIHREQEEYKRKNPGSYRSMYD